jgi:hypothetical protein
MSYIKDILRTVSHTNVTRKYTVIPPPIIITADSQFTGINAVILHSRWTCPGVTPYITTTVNSQMTLIFGNMHFNV